MMRKVLFAKQSIKSTVTEKTPTITRKMSSSTVGGHHGWSGAAKNLKYLSILMMVFVMCFGLAESCRGSLISK